CERHGRSCVPVHIRLRIGRDEDAVDRPEGFRPHRRLASDAGSRPLRYGRHVDRGGAGSVEDPARRGMMLRGRPGYDVVPVDGVDEPEDRADDLGPGPAIRPLSRRRAIVGGLLLTVVFIAAGLAVYRQRDAIADTFRQVGLWPVLLSGVFGLVAVGVTFPMW